MDEPWWPLKWEKWEKWGSPNRPWFTSTFTIDASGRTLYVTHHPLALHPFQAYVYGPDETAANPIAQDIDDLIMLRCVLLNAAYSGSNPDG